MRGSSGIRFHIRIKKKSFSLIDFALIARIPLRRGPVQLILVLNRKELILMGCKGYHVALRLNFTRPTTPGHRTSFKEIPPLPVYVKYFFMCNRPKSACRIFYSLYYSFKNVIQSTLRSFMPLWGVIGL